jgi:RND family efflux transporter MFP subunit
LSTSPVITPEARARYLMSRPKRYRAIFVGLSLLSIATSSSCSRREVSAKTDEHPGSLVSVGVSLARTQPIGQQLTLSSELVPFQEIDVYAKTAGYVKELYVDYGSHVRKGQLLAILEVPELEAQLQQDRAAIQAQTDEINRAKHEVERAKAQHNVYHLQHERLSGVAATKPGLVAQQEVDDAEGKDLAAESQMDAVQGAYQAAQSQLVVAKAKLAHDQALYDYSKITAPFDGVVTQRFANLGALMQAGTTSTQATPLVRLSQENLYRLVIPVPESYVRYIRAGDQVEVRVPSLEKSFQGKVTRFSVDVNGSTRTMHTEVDIPNSSGQLLPGLYAEAVLTLGHKASALVVPLQAVNRQNDRASVFVVKPDGVLQQRQVFLGMQGANYVEVASGLREGEPVVVSDRSALKAGQQVKPQVVQGMVYEGSDQ